LLDTTASSIQGLECSRDLPFPGILSTSEKPQLQWDGLLLP